MSKLNPDNIKTVDVRKGKASIEKYGQRAKDGVIEITLKESVDPASLFEDSENSIHLEQNEADAETSKPSKKYTAKDLGIHSIRISPNPTSGRLSIEFDAEELLMEIIGYDMYGKELFRRTTYGGHQTISDIDVSNVPKGNILIAFRKGEKLYTEIIAVQ